MAHSREHRRTAGIIRSGACTAVLIIAAATTLCAAPANAQDVALPPEIVLDAQPSGRPWSITTALAMPDPGQLKSVKIDPALRALVQQLEDPSFDVREEATRKLIEMAPDQMQLYAMLSPESDLSPEQRYRLLAALREHLLNSPRGAVGISMEPVQQLVGGPLEIRVTDLLPGLPAERVLKINDRITHVDDQPLFAYDDLQFRVQCKRPGDTVTLTIKRPKTEPEANAAREANHQPQFETLRVELELGSAELLREFNEVRAQQMNQRLPANPNRVDTMRIAQAKAADQNFAPRPRTVVITGHSSIVAGDENVLLHVLDPDIEDHPAVKMITSHRKMIERGDVEPHRLQIMRDQWDRQLIDLYRQAQSRMLTSDQRDYLFAVIERCIELMQE